MMKCLTLSTVLFLGACSILPQPKPTRYRTMLLDVEPAPAAARVAGTQARTGVSVALRAVELPAYLEGDMLVTRAGDHEIRYSNDERWGEPLAAAVPRILAAQLTHQGLELRPGGSSADDSVEVSIDRFEADVRGRAELRARWTVYGRERRTAVKSGEARLVDEQGGPPPAAMSRLLGRLGEAIAADLRGDVVSARNP